MEESPQSVVFNNRAKRDTSSQRGRNSRKDSDILHSPFSIFNFSLLHTLRAKREVYFLA